MSRYKKASALKYLLHSCNLFLFNGFNLNIFYYSMIPRAAALVKIKGKVHLLRLILF